MLHLFVINPRSFRNMRELKTLEQEIAGCFDESDNRRYHIHISRYSRDAVCIVRKHAEQNPSGIRVYAVGGDGILFDCANGLIGFPAAELATVPYGSSNDFARAISGGETEKLRSIRSLLTMPSAPADAVQCGSNHFLNFCSLGIESAAIINSYKQIEKYVFLKKLSKIKNLIGKLFFVNGIISSFNKRITKQFYKINIDGCDYDGYYSVVNFSNGPYYGGDKSVMPEAVLNNGIVEVLLVKSMGSVRLLSMIPAYLRGGYKKYPDYITHLQAKEISVSSETPICVNLDGEFFLDTNMALKVIPSAVNIIAGGNAAFWGEAGK